MSKKNNKVKNAIDTDNVIYSMNPICIDNIISIVDIDAIIKAMHLVDTIKTMYIDDVIKTTNINELIKILNIDKAIKKIEIVITKTIDKKTKVVDIDELIKIIDIDELIKTIDIDELIETLDIDELIETPDIELIKTIDIDEFKKALNIDELIKTIYIYEAIKAVDIEKLTKTKDIDKLTKKIDIDEVVNALNVDELIRVKDIIVKATRHVTNRNRHFDRMFYYNYFGTIIIKKGKFGPKESTGYLLSVQVPKIIGVGKTYIAVVVEIKKRFQMMPNPSVIRRPYNKSNIKIIDNDNGYSIYISREILYDTTTKNDNNTVIFYDGKQFIEGKIVIADIIGGGATGPATEDGLPTIDE